MVAKQESSRLQVWHLAWSPGYSKEKKKKNSQRQTPTVWVGFYLCCVFISMFVLTYVGSVWKNTGQLGDPGTLRTVCVRSICAMLPVSKQAPWMNWLNKSLAGYGFLIWNCEYGFLIWNCEAFVFVFFLKASRYPNQETSVPEQEV